MRPALFLTIFLMFAGVFCPASDKVKSGRISDFLDPDGIEYQIIKAPAFKAFFDRFDADITKAVWKDGISAEHRRTVLSWLAAFKMAWQVSGLENSSGIGSSTSLTGAEGIFHSRIFLGLDSSAPGLLNEFFVGNDLKSEEFFNDLPGGKVFTAKAHIRPEALLDALGKCGRYGEKIADMLPAAFPMRELLQNAQGVWAVSFMLEDGEGFFRLTLPDPGNKLFNMAVNVFRAAAEAEKGTITLPTVFIAKGTERIAVYNSKKAEEVFRNAGKLQLSPEKEAALFYRIPENACALFFCNFSEAESGKMKIFGLEIPDSLPTGEAAGAVSHEKEGFLTVFNSNRTALDSTLDEGMYLFEILSTDPGEDAKKDDASADKEEEKSSRVPETTEDTGKPAAESEEKAPVVEDEVLPPTEKKCKCKTHFALFDIQFPDGTEAGVFRVKKGRLVRVAPGEKFELACFGKIGAEKPVPWLLAYPHEGAFCIRYADGKEEKISLAHPRQLRRIISFLHTIHRYDENLFRQLIDLATGFEVK